MAHMPGAMSDGNDIVYNQHGHASAPKATAALEDFLVNHPRVTSEGPDNGRESLLVQDTSMNMKFQQLPSADSRPSARGLPLRTNPDVSHHDVPQQLMARNRSAKSSSMAYSRKIYTCGHENSDPFPTDNTVANFHILIKQSTQLTVFHWSISHRGWQPIADISDHDIHEFTQEIDALVFLNYQQDQDPFQTSNSQDIVDRDFFMIVQRFGERHSQAHYTARVGNESILPHKNITFTYRPSYADGKEFDSFQTPNAAGATVNEHNLVHANFANESARAYLNQGPLVQNPHYIRYASRYNPAPQLAHSQRDGFLGRRSDGSIPTMFTDHHSRSRPPPIGYGTSQPSLPAAQSYASRMAAIEQQANLSPTKYRKPTDSTVIPDNQVGVMSGLAPDNYYNRHESGHRQQQDSDLTLAYTDTSSPVNEPAQVAAGPDGQSLGGSQLDSWAIQSEVAKAEYEKNLNDFWNSGKLNFDLLQHSASQAFQAGKWGHLKDNETNTRLGLQLCTQLEAYANPNYTIDNRCRLHPALDSISKNSPFLPALPNLITPPHSRTQQHGAAAQTQKPGLQVSRSSIVPDIKEPFLAPGSIMAWNHDRMAHSSLGDVGRQTGPRHVFLSVCRHANVGVFCAVCEAWVVHDPPESTSSRP